MGKSRSHIANLMRLCNSMESSKITADGELSVGHAKVLLGIDDGPPTALGRQAVWRVDGPAIETRTNGFALSSNGTSRRVYPLFI